MYGAGAVELDVLRHPLPASAVGGFLLAAAPPNEAEAGCAIVVLIRLVHVRGAEDQERGRVERPLERRILALLQWHGCHRLPRACRFLRPPLLPPRSIITAQSRITAARVAARRRREL